MYRQIIYETNYRALRKLKWLKAGRAIESKGRRQCFLTYPFPHFTWLFPFSLLLPQTQQKVLEQKFRVGLLLVHCCPFTSANKLYAFTAKQPLEFYVKRYIRRRLRTMHTTDLGSFCISFVISSLFISLSYLSFFVSVFIIYFSFESSYPYVNSCTSDV